MATHDYVIANASGAAVRADLNNALAAIVSNNSNATAPATTYAYMWWADTTNGQLKLRNAANDGWITIQELDGTMLMENGSAASPGLAFASDLDTGFYRIGANQLGIATNGTAAVAIDSSQRVGIGTTSASSTVHIVDSSSAANGTIRLGGGSGSSGYYSTIQQDAVTTGKLIYNSVAAAGTVHGHQLQVDGTVALTIDASRRVGIGTQSSNSILTTKGSFITVQNSGGSNVGFIGTADNVISGGSSTDFGISTSGGSLLFGSGGTTERARIDSSGRLLVGTSSAIAALEPSIQTARSNGAFLALGRDDTSITDDETLGAIYFYGNQGSSWSSSARIEAKADAAWGTNDYPSKLVFFTCPDSSATPVERMRISNIGTTSFFGAQDVIYSRAAASAGTTYATFAGVYNATGTGVGGTVSFVVWSNGNVVNTNNSYGSLSDIKLKENITDASPQWDDIKALQIRKYNFKEGQTHTQIGLIAQEVELISPGLVTESPDRDAEGNDLGTVTKSVNYSVLYMKAVKALQEAMERIEQLEAKVAALESA